jgi:hypothetical protein
MMEKRRKGSFRVHLRIINSITESSVVKWRSQPHTRYHQLVRYTEKVTAGIN